MEGGNPVAPGRPPARQQRQPALGHRRQSTQILCNPGSGRTAAPGAAPLSQRPGWSGPMIPPELLAPFQIGVLFLLIAIAPAVFIAEQLRSDEMRAGKACVRTGRPRGAPHT